MIIVTFATLMGLFGPAPVAATEPAEIEVAGYWYTHDRQAIIEISDCGDGSPCGTVAEILVPNEAPEMIGTELISGFERCEDGWRKGRILDPETGRQYRSALRLMQDGALEVKGCIGPMCRTLVWEPAPAVDSKVALTEGQ